jgi:hypothetical protein
MRDNNFGYYIQLFARAIHVNGNHIESLNYRIILYNYVHKFGVTSSQSILVFMLLFQ